jgi:hypothetical protein
MHKYIYKIDPQRFVIQGSRASPVYHYPKKRLPHDSVVVLINRWKVCQRPWHLALELERARVDRLPEGVVECVREPVRSVVPNEVKAGERQAWRSEGRVRRRADHAWVHTERASVVERIVKAVVVRLSADEEVWILPRGVKHVPGWICRRSRRMPFRRDSRHRRHHLLLTHLRYSLLLSGCREGVVEGSWWRRDVDLRYSEGWRSNLRTGVRRSREIHRWFPG